MKVEMKVASMVGMKVGWMVEWLVAHWQCTEWWVKMLLETRMWAFLWGKMKVRTLADL